MRVKRREEEKMRERNFERDKIHYMRAFTIYIYMYIIIIATVEVESEKQT